MSAMVLGKRPFTDVGVDLELRLSCSPSAWKPLASSSSSSSSYKRQCQWPASSSASSLRRKPSAAAAVANPQGHTQHNLSHDQETRSHQQQPQQPHQQQQQQQQAQRQSQGQQALPQPPPYACAARGSSPTFPAPPGQSCAVLLCPISLGLTSVSPSGTPSGTPHGTPSGALSITPLAASPPDHFIGLVPPRAETKSPAGSPSAQAQALCTAQATEAGWFDWPQTPQRKFDKEGFVWRECLHKSLFPSTAQLPPPAAEVSPAHPRLRMTEAAPPRGAAPVMPWVHQTDASEGKRGASPPRSGPKNALLPAGIPGRKKIAPRIPPCTQEWDCSKEPDPKDLATFVSHKQDSNGQKWKKYSHKLLQNCSFERIYYSCAEKETCGCKARKIVDRPKVRHWRGDSVRDLVTLDGEHNHGPPPAEDNFTA